MDTSLTLEDLKSTFGLSDVRLQKHIRNGLPIMDDGTVDIDQFQAFLNEEAARIEASGVEQRKRERKPFSQARFEAECVQGDHEADDLVRKAMQEGRPLARWGWHEAILRRGRPWPLPI
jgi:hypothetical protein